jgi:hypothetical protein
MLGGFVWTTDVATAACVSESETSDGVMLNVCRKVFHSIIDNFVHLPSRRMDIVTTHIGVRDEVQSREMSA